MWKYSQRKVDKKFQKPAGKTGRGLGGMLKNAGDIS
jgi:hypothetical protein